MTFALPAGEENAIPYSPELNKTTKGPFSGDRGKGSKERAPLMDSVSGNATFSLVGYDYGSPM